jgi:hypothetical protein
MLGSKELIILMTAATSDDPLATVTKALQNLLKTAIDEGARTYATEREAELKQHNLDVENQQDKDDPSNKKEHAQQDTDENTFDSNFRTTRDSSNISDGTGAVGGLDVTSMLKLAQTMSKDQLAELFKSDPQIKGNKAIQTLMTKINERRRKNSKPPAKKWRTTSARMTKPSAPC